MAIPPRTANNRREGPDKDDNISDK
jgi:hypothetical protein